jgi:hypothetical protein
MSMLCSTSFGVGLARRDLARDGDRLTVAISQPLRVEAGDAAIDRPSRSGTQPFGREITGRTTGAVSDRTKSPGAILVRIELLGLA